MNILSDLLHEADPLRRDPSPHEEERERVRQVVLAEAPQITRSSSSWGRPLVGVLAALALLILGIVAISSQSWSHGSTTLHAAVRFEVRLAETQPGAGLHATRVANSGAVVYLHEDTIVANDDISRSRVIEDDGRSRFSVEVEFNSAGADKMRRATEGRIGGLLAILVDGDVMSVPTIRGSIGASALITGDYTRAEAERIAGGITPR